MPSTVSTGTPSWPKLGLPFLALPAGWTGATAPLQFYDLASTPSLQARASSKGTRLARCCFLQLCSQPFEKPPNVRLNFVFRTWMMPSLRGRPMPVAAALRVFQAEAAAAGLVLEPSKCELVLVAGDASTVDLSAFPASFRSSKLLPLSFWARRWGTLITATLSPSRNELARRQPAWRL